VPAPIFPFRYGGVAHASSIVSSILLLPLQPRNPARFRDAAFVEEPISSVLPPVTSGSESICSLYA